MTQAHWKLRWRIIWTLGLGIGMWLSTASGVGPALAQEIPPFPILYGGTAFVDGEPLPEGTRVVAKVGDYETWATVEQSGSYRNLLVAPPSRDYYFVPVTFHASGLTAAERDVFLPSGAPAFKSTGFDLHFSRLEAEGTPRPAASPTPVTSPGPESEPAALIPTVTPESTPQATATPGNGDHGIPARRIGIGGGIIALLAGGWFLLRKVWQG